MKVGMSIWKRILRNHRNGDHVTALLELNALISEHPDCWIAYGLRADVHSALNRRSKATHDYITILKQPQCLSKRHLQMFKQNFWFACEKLSRPELVDLQETLGKDFDLSFQEFPKSSTSGENSKPATPPEPATFPVHGRITNIGKFLLDQNDLDKIGKLSTKAAFDNANIRGLDAQDFEKLVSLLRKVDEQSGAIGSCIVSNDGFLMLSTLPQELDSRSIGISALAAFGHAVKANKEQKRKPLKQIVTNSQLGQQCILDFDSGILIVTIKDFGANNQASVLRKIRQLIGKKTGLERSKTIDLAAVSNGDKR